MSKKDDVKNYLLSKISNLHNFIEDCSSDKIYIAEYNENNTSYLLKSVDSTNETGKIEVRKGEGKTAKQISFDIKKVFTICNSSEISFIPIDGKGLLKTANCDFVFFNKYNFCFVEMKLNAISLDPRKIEDNRNKAVEQLQYTIDYFDTTLSKNYLELMLEAYIATPDTYPRENTAFQSIQVQFLEKTGIQLFESREKMYESQMKNEKKTIMLEEKLEGFL
jgi:hypothetical protein